MGIYRKIVWRKNWAAKRINWMVRWMEPPNGVRAVNSPTWRTMDDASGDIFLDVRSFRQVCGPTTLGFGFLHLWSLQWRQSHRLVHSPTLACIEQYQFYRWKFRSTLLGLTRNQSLLFPQHRRTTRLSLLFILLQTLLNSSNVVFVVDLIVSNMVDK